MNVYSVVTVDLLHRFPTNLTDHRINVFFSR